MYKINVAQLSKEQKIEIYYFYYTPLPTEDILDNAFQNNLHASFRTKIDEVLGDKPRTIFIEDDMHRLSCLVIVGTKFKDVLTE